MSMLGGKNKFGGDNFKIVWGGNHTHKVGGKFKKVMYAPTGIIGEPPKAIVTEVCEIRELLSFHPFRWHLLRWRGPEWYGTPEEWYANTWDEECRFHTQGDFPSEGDYEHCFYLAQCSHMKPGDTEWCRLCQVTSGEYIPLEENIHVLEMQINALRMSEDVSKDAEQKELFLREDKKRQEYSKIVGERVRNAMRPKLVINPSTLRDDTGQCSVPDAGTTRVGIDRKDVKLGLTQS